MLPAVALQSSFAPFPALPVSCLGTELDQENEFVLLQVTAHHKSIVRTAVVTSASVIADA